MAMATCPVCAERPPAVVAGPYQTLLLRVWREGTLRGRLIGGDGPPMTIAVGAGVDGSTEAVRDWLATLEAGAGS